MKLIRLPRGARFYVACLMLIIYCLVTGASTPVLRASIMTVVFMFSYIVKREPDIYNSLCIAAIFILAINPQQLFDAGFQLSFASVISIVYLYPRIKTFLKLGAVKIKFLNFCIDGVLVSFSAWLGTAGFIAYYFKIFSPVTVLANLFIVPLASLITLCGFCLVAAAFLCPALAGLFSATTELIILVLININNLSIKIPGAYFYL